MTNHCKICNKTYSSYKSLWNHNKNIHGEFRKSSEKVLKSSDEIRKNTDIVLKNSMTGGNQEPKKYCCRTCNKQFVNVKTRWSHEKKCKIAENKKSELEIIKENNIRLKEEARILKLKEKLQNSTKVEPVTLRKLNKMLLAQRTRIENSNINTNSTVNSHNTQNNIVNYNTTYQLIGFGKEENIHQILTNQEKRDILGSRYGSLEKLIETVHCGKYDRFKNIIVTNMKDNYMYKYDDKKGVFVLCTKAEVLNSLVDFRMGDLEVIYNEFLENNRIGDVTKRSLERFINDIHYVNDKFTNTDGTTYDNYKQYKIHEIKMLLYNNQDKIANDICLFLSAEEEIEELI